MPPAQSRQKHVPSRPTIRPERNFSDINGGCLVAGIDEAGRGPLAGPVAAGCVVWDFEGRRPTGIADSKQLTASDRERLFGQIQRRALAWGVGICTAGEIDLINILQATKLASQRAFEAAQLMLGSRRIGALVTDFLDIPAIGLPTLSLVKGDCHSASVAAASILAKVTRDRMMDRYHEEFPYYRWDSNKGYSTPDHYAALALHGPSTLHRLTFNGVGFFDSKPLRSLFYQEISVKVLECPPCPDRLACLRDDVENRAEFLPPPDYESLIELIDDRLAQAATA